ncbi:TPA: AbrB/MazE/SpoVT family DNA-binding domain-containing protein [Candidatus Woesearchaeota archaeon]|nr:AbrB/MazE/SpoVT family DNA-binding domain-containing protein [Candidatus Woesearchaeota archaeon]HIH12099.1 AbrB/MazE/SpoVT family DNA-binding domain-containing protein [Candidatus Woesearchaeota archaeon]
MYNKKFAQINRAPYTMETIAKTWKIGGSLVVTIPKAVVEEESLQENQLIEIDIHKLPKSGFGLFKGIGPFTSESEFRGQLDE